MRVGASAHVEVEVRDGCAVDLMLMYPQRPGEALMPRRWFALSRVPLHLD